MYRKTTTSFVIQTTKMLFLVCVCVKKADICAFIGLSCINIDSIVLGNEKNIKNLFKTVQINVSHNK